MRHAKRGWAAYVIVAGVLGLAAFPAPVVGGSPHGPVVLSQENSFARACFDAVAPVAALRTHRDSESAVRLIVDPQDHDHALAMWLQDPLRKYDASGLGAVVTHDGGRSWDVVDLPAELTRCEPRAFDIVAGFSVAFGAAGTAILAVVLKGEPDHCAAFFLCTQTLAVGDSSDGGQTWSPLLRLARGDVESAEVAAHATEPGRMMVAWAQGPSVFVSDRAGPAGDWSTPMVTATVPNAAKTGPFQALILPDGTSVLGLFQRPVHVNDDQEASHRGVYAQHRPPGSGAWSDPVLVGEATVAVPTDPDGQRKVWLDSGVAMTADDDGTVAAIWTTSAGGFQPDGFRWSTSGDAGATWSPPLPVAQATTSHSVFEPSIAFGDDVLGVSFYDFRNDAPGDGELTADAWVRLSSDGGRSWAEEHLVGPFDFGAAPDDGGNLFLGPVGLAAVGRGMKAAFLAPDGWERPGRTDVFFDEVGGRDHGDKPGNGPRERAPAALGSLDAHFAGAYRVGVAAFPCVDANFGVDHAHRFLWQVPSTTPEGKSVLVANASLTLRGDENVFDQGLRFVPTGGDFVDVDSVSGSSEDAFVAGPWPSGVFEMTTYACLAFEGSFTLDVTVALLEAPRGR